MFDAVRGRHAQQDGDGFTIVEAAVTTDDQCRITERRAGIENGLDEVLEIVRLSEYRNGLAQSSGARFLIVERAGNGGENLHHASGWGGLPSLGADLRMI